MNKLKYLIILIPLFIISFFVIGIETKAQEGDNLGLTWTSGTDTFGTYKYAELNYETNDADFAGFVFSDDYAVIMNVYTPVYSIVVNQVLIPNEYLIQHQENFPEFSLTIYIGDVAPANLLVEIIDDWYAIDELTISFKYYTSGLAYNLYDLGTIDVVTLEDAWNGGYAIGKANQQVITNTQSTQRYNEGLDEGTADGIIEGQNDIMDDGAFAHGFISADAFDYVEGYNEGFNLGLNSDISPIGFIRTFFYGIGYLFAIELIPSISIGTIALMVLMIKLLPFIIGLFSGGKKD